MHSIRLGIVVLDSKWTASGVRVGSLNGCGIGNRMNRREASLLRTRCRKGMGRNLSRLLNYLVCGLVGVSGVCWMKQSIKYNSVSREGNTAVVAGGTVGHDGMNGSAWLGHGRDEVPAADWLNASVVAPTVYVTPPLEESSSWFFRFLL